MHFKSVAESCSLHCLVSLWLLAGSPQAWAGFRPLQDWKDQAGGLSSRTIALRELDDPEHILLIDPSGAYARTSLKTRKVEESGTLALGEGCGPGFLAQAKFVRPFFLGKTSLCVLEENTHRIVSAPKPGFEKGTYGSVFWSSDEQTVRFLINGRPWPGGEEGSGFVSVLEIDRLSRQSRVRPLLTGVPGFSGGMAVQAGSLYVAAWLLESASSRVYRLETATLESRVEQMETARFLDEARTLPGEWKGGTGLLRAGSGELLFDNSTEEDAGESFRVNARTGASLPAEIPANCRVLGEYHEEWLLVCGGTRFMTGSFGSP